MIVYGNSGSVDMAKTTSMGHVLRQLHLQKIDFLLGMPEGERPFMNAFCETSSLHHNFASKCYLKTASLWPSPAEYMQ